MKKRLLAVLLCACLWAGLLLPALAAEDASAYLKSGSLGMVKLSKEEIAQLLNANPLGFSGQAMARQPSLTAPYDQGLVSSEALDAALDRFNALRWLAGLPGVKLDEDLNRRAQYGAALLAATGKLTHHPDKPADMDEVFYQSGHNATSSSNIYQGTGATLPQAVEAFFDDSDAGNLPSLGHRRWMLNPSMSKTGLGFSPSSFTYGSLTYNFATLWAFDREGPGVSYDFIGWPASGNFPSTLFHKNQAWSVTLDPERYAPPVLADLTVTVVRESDGKTWTLSGAQSYSPADQGAYLGVDLTNYGVANAIIFRPDLGGEGYRGVYTVTIQGVKTLQGLDVPFSYQVDFFDPAQLGGTSTVTPQPGQSLTAFSDVVAGSWYEEAVAYATQKALFNGVGGNRFDPNGPMTRAMVMTVLARLDGEDTTPQYLETWDIRGRRWAVTNRISDGLNPEKAITLEELATMLYRYAQLRHGAQAAHSYHLPGMPDGNRVSSWAAEAANWAVDKGILIGDQDQKLNPQRTATRAQVAIVLQRFLD